MDLRDTMTVLASQFGLPPLSPDADGIFALELNAVTVNFCPLDEPDAFYVQSCLGAGRADDLDLLEALMAENFNPYLSSDGVLGVDEETTVFMTRRFTSESHPQLLDTLSGFVARAQAWQERLSTASTKAGHDAR